MPVVECITLYVVCITASEEVESEARGGLVKPVKSDLCALGG